MIRLRKISSRFISICRISSNDHLLLKTTEEILAKAERVLRDQEEFNEKRIRATADNYRRLARWAYPADIDSFNRCLDQVLRLSPQYRPEKPNARLISSIFGFRNYEKFATVIRRVNYSKNNDWY